MTEDEAMKDFHERLRKYQDVYQTLDEHDSDKSYIKLINVGRQVLANNIRGYLQAQIVTFLMNYHVTPRSIFITTWRKHSQHPRDIGRGFCAL